MFHTSINRALPVFTLSFLILFSACSPQKSSSEYPTQRKVQGVASDGWADMSQTVIGARGLFTSPSFLTSAPPGGMLEALNAVVDVQGEFTTRKGFERLAQALPGNLPVKSWTFFRGILIAHAGTGLYRYVGTSWTAFPGTYAAPDDGENQDGDVIPGRVRFMDTGSTLYFTTAAGLYRLESPVGTPERAGVAPGIPGSTALSSGTGQSLRGGKAVAYRYVWGRRAEDGTLQFGPPSDRVVVENPTTTYVPTAVEHSGNLTTLTFATAHGRIVGESIFVAPSPADDTAFTGGLFEITAVTTTAPHTITYEEDVPSSTATVPGEFSVLFTPEPKDVTHTVPVPAEADDSYFLQAYRSDEAEADAGPSDELYLVYEKPIATMPEGATEHTFTDGTPDALKADALYTNANFGGGIAAARNRPPLARTMVSHKGRAFYGNVEYPERMTLTLLAVGSTNGLNSGQGIVFTFADGVTETYTADSTLPIDTDKFQVFTSGTPAENVVDTIGALAAEINSRAGGRLYASSSGGEPGTLGTLSVEAREAATGAFTVTAIERGDMWFPTLNARARVPVGSMSRSGGNLVTVFVDTGVSGIGHGYQVGQTVILLPPSDPDDAVDFPAGPKVITQVPTNDSFRYSEAGPNGNIDATVYFTTSAPAVESYDDAAVGGFAYSDELSFESVPNTAPEIAGNREKRLLRFLSLGESLFMLKEDGLFRLSGTDPTSFSVECIDSTVSFVAPEAAVTIGQTAYALTTQGLMSWTEGSKPAPTSLPIEADLRRIITSGGDAYMEANRDNAFMVADPAKRRLYLWLSDSDAGVHAGANVVYVYSLMHGTWTRWDKGARTAVMDHAAGRLYIAPPENLATGLALAPARERNTNTTADYQDEEGQAIQTTLAWSHNYGSSPNLQKIWVWSSWYFAGTVPSQVEVSFATDWQPSRIWFPLSNTHSQQPGTVSTPPTQEHSRGNLMSVAIRHGQVGVPLRILGYGMKLREYRSN